MVLLVIRDFSMKLLRVDAYDVQRMAPVKILQASDLISSIGRPGEAGIRHSMAQILTVKEFALPYIFDDLPGYIQD